MATLRDVAQHASVSQTTVSQTLRNPDVVNAHTRERVKQAIAELGYRQRGVGRPSKKQRQENIALIYRGAFGEQPITSSAPWRWFDAIQHRLQESGYQVSIFGSPSEHASDSLFRKMVQQKRLQGAIFIGGSQGEDLIWAADQELATLAIHQRPRNHEFSFIDMDNAGGGTQAAEHLIAAGHQKIALIHPPATLYYTEERLRGFREALARHQLSPVFTAEATTAPGAVSWPSFIQKLLSSGASAVFTSSDDLALMLLNELHAAGISVPRQMSVIGFDDKHYRSPRGLRLTSIGFQYALIGQLAIDLLQRLMIHGPKQCRLNAHVTTELIRGETVTPITAPTGP